MSKTQRQAKEVKTAILNLLSEKYSEFDKKAVLLGILEAEHTRRSALFSLRF